MLSNEEIKIINLITHGNKNIEIAEKLGYCESTIKKRLTTIYKKLRIKNRYDLITKRKELSKYLTVRTLIPLKYIRDYTISIAIWEKYFF